jgi:hypothetical protein
VDRQTFVTMNGAIMKTSRDQAPASEYEAFLLAVFEQLADYKKFPKYQLERRVDGFIGAFLCDILREKLGWETEIVAPEFPIKKEGNNQSTNIDYLVYRTAKGSIGAAWILVELKTETESLGPEQLSVYESVRQKMQMRELMSDVETIKKATKKKAKYETLLAQFKGRDLDAPVEVLFLVPAQDELLKPGPGFSVLTFSDLDELELPRYADVWRSFRDIMIPAII